MFLSHRVGAPFARSIDRGAPCFLIADDIMLAKKPSNKIELVHYQDSGNEHDVIAGIARLFNFSSNKINKSDEQKMRYLVDFLGKVVSF